MNWLERTEQNRKLLIGGTVIICLAALIVTGRRIFYGFDGFWHLQAGLDWIENGLSPWLDHFSFTFNGGAISGPPYIFQALLGWLVKLFGLEAGFQIYRLSSFLFLFGLFIAFLRKLKAPVLIYCLVLPQLVVLLQYRNLIRPELLLYSFSVVAIMLYYRSRHEMSARGMLPILGLMIMWNNYHALIIGYIVFFGYFVDIALKQVQDRAPIHAWLRWLGWGFAMLAVGFLNPDFNHPLLAYLNFSPEWAKHTIEYYDYTLYFETAAFYVLIAITLITLVLLAWRRQFGLLIVCIIFVYYSSTMSRLITPGGIIILAIFSWMICEIDLGSLSRRLTAIPFSAVGGLVLVFIILTLGSGVYRSREYMAENRLLEKQYPQDVVDYMIKHNMSGRIFNEFAIGGYLIHRLSPDSQVYVDGRTNILYPIEHVELFLEALQSPDILRSEVEKYDINLAIQPNNLDPFRLFHSSGTLGLDFVGTKFSLFKKDDPNFPLLGSLLAQPACWSADMSIALEQEQIRASAILPEDSMLLPFAKFVVNYTQAEDKMTYLNNTEERNRWTTPDLRFAGYQALDQGLYHMALTRFAGLSNWEFQDFLGSAMAFVHLEEWLKAEQILDAASRQPWPTMQLNDLIIMHGLLAYIEENALLELFEDDYVKRLGEQISAGETSKSAFVPDINFFCTKN